MFYYDTNSMSSVTRKIFLILSPSYASPAPSPTAQVIKAITRLFWVTYSTSAQVHTLQWGLRGVLNSIISLEAPTELRALK